MTTLCTPRPTHASAAPAPRPSRILVRTQLERRASDELRRSQRLDPRHPAPRDEPPEPGPWAAGLGAAIVDTARGLRPIGQIQRWVAPEVGDAVAALVRSRPPSRSRMMRAITRSTRAVRISADAAEVALTVDDGMRQWIIAMRLERVRGRWLATALELA